MVILLALLVWGNQIATCAPATESGFQQGVAGVSGRRVRPIQFANRLKNVRALDIDTRYTSLDWLAAYDAAACLNEMPKDQISDVLDSVGLDAFVSEGNIAESRKVMLVLRLAFDHTVVSNNTDPEDVKGAYWPVIWQGKHPTVATIPYGATGPPYGPRFDFIYLNKIFPRRELGIPVVLTDCNFADVLSELPAWDPETLLTSSQLAKYSLVARLLQRASKSQIQHIYERCFGARQPLLAERMKLFVILTAMFSDEPRITCIDAVVRPPMRKKSGPSLYRVLELMSLQVGADGWISFNGIPVWKELLSQFDFVSNYTKMLDNYSFRNISED